MAEATAPQTLRRPVKVEETGGATKLTPGIADIIVAAVKAGATWEYAALKAGITRQTLQNWRERGAQDESGPFHDLFERLAEAEVDHEESLRLIALGVAQGGMVETEEREERDGQDRLVRRRITKRTKTADGRVALDMLGRRYPERWSRHQNLNLNRTGGDAPSFTVQFNVVNELGETMDVSQIVEATSHRVLPDQTPPAEDLTEATE